MDWFEKLTGFREIDYHSMRSKLAVEGRRLRSLVNGASYGVGELEIVSLQTLRDRAARIGAPPGRLKVSVVTGDVRRMHRSPENAGALFQVASQFNLLEMVGPSVTPEQGVTRYQDDHTQGPACAIAAGAATIYRNYFVPVDGSHGQTATRQINTLADLGEAFSDALKTPVATLWTMRNGYALCTRAGLDAISAISAVWMLLRPTSYAESCVSAYIVTWRRPKPWERIGPSSPRSFAPRCLLRTNRLCRLLIGKDLRVSSWRPLTKRLCWPPHSTPNAACRMSCS